MSKEEVTHPVRIIISNKETSLGNLLKENNLFDHVKNGKKIVLLEGKSLMNLDLIVPPGKRLVVIAIDVLGGG